MRDSMAERFADALGMKLHLETASVKGGQTVFVSLGEGLTLPIELNVTGHFDAGAQRDAGILLKGPGDLLCFLGYDYAADCTNFVIIDAARLEKPALDTMRLINVVSALIVAFGPAVCGHWKQRDYRTVWLDAADGASVSDKGTAASDIPF